MKFVNFFLLRRYQKKFLIKKKFKRLDFPGFRSLAHNDGLYGHTCLVLFNTHCIFQNSRARHINEHFSIPKIRSPTNVTNGLYIKRW